MEQLCLQLILSKSKISRIVPIMSIRLLQLKFSELVVLSIDIYSLRLHVGCKPPLLHPINKKLLLLLISISCQDLL